MSNVFRHSAYPSYVVTDEQKDGDFCHTCNQPLERAIIAHDPIMGNTLGWECPQCKEAHFAAQQLFAQAAHVGL